MRLVSTVVAVSSNISRKHASLEMSDDGVPLLTDKAGLVFYCSKANAPQHILVAPASLLAAAPHVNFPHIRTVRSAPPLKEEGEGQWSEAVELAVGNLSGYLPFLDNWVHRTASQPQALRALAPSA